MKSILCSDYITYEDVMNQKEIFVISNDNGTFFLCFDYYAPKEAKIWYKFTIDPFDIEFLQFKRLDYGIITDDDFSKEGLSTSFRYFHTCRKDLVNKNTNFVSEIFFRGGKPLNTIKKIQEKPWRKKLYSKEDYYGLIDIKRFYRIKSKITSSVKTWLYHIYQEYNFLDKSLEYIRDYYNKWVILVDLIQEQKESIIKPIWRFINSNNIHSFKDFYYAWKKVVNKDIYIRGVGREDIEKFHNLLNLLVLEKFYWE